MLETHPIVSLAGSVHPREFNHSRIGANQTPRNFRQLQHATPLCTKCLWLLELTISLRNTRQSLIWAHWLPTLPFTGARVSVIARISNVQRFVQLCEA
jgi:hypothetical protein